MTDETRATEETEGHALRGLKIDANAAESGDPYANPAEAEGHAFVHKRDINDADGGDAGAEPSEAEGHAFFYMKRDVNDAEGGDPLATPEEAG
jgi:hypothetical protein